MQLERAHKDEVSAMADRLVGARGANAAQRASRAVHLASFPQFQNPDAGLEQVTAVPAVRQPDVPANDHSPVAKRAGAVGRRSRPKKALAGLATAILLAAGGWYGFHWLTIGRFIVSTDDAYVHADATTLAAKVSGYVSAIGVADNTHVHAGDVIARIDDGDYRLAVDTARDKLATQQATVARIGKQIDAQSASVEQAKAQLASARAVAIRTELESSASRNWRPRSSPAGRPSNRRKRTAIKPSPACKARRQRSIPRSPASRCSRPSARRRRGSAGVEHRIGQDRARFVLHRHSRADRRRDRQPRHAGWRLRADRPAPGELGAAGRGLHRRQFQGDAAGAAQARATGRRSASTPWPTATSRAP